MLRAEPTVRLDSRESSRRIPCVNKPTPTKIPLGFASHHECFPCAISWRPFHWLWLIMCYRLSLVTPEREPSEGLLEGRHHPRQLAEVLSLFLRQASGSGSEPSLVSTPSTIGGVTFHSVSDDPTQVLHLWRNSLIDSLELTPLTP